MAQGSHTTLGPWARRPCSACGQPIPPKTVSRYEWTPEHGYRCWHASCDPFTRKATA